MRPYIKYQPWEDAFIRLVFPTHTYKDIATHLGRTEKSIKQRAYVRLGIRIANIKIGDVFDTWKVIEFHGITNHRRMYSCQCILCGRISKRPAGEWRYVKRKKCFCSRLTGYGDIPGTHLGHVRKRAIRDNIAFTTTPQKLDSLFKKQKKTCSLSGLPISFNKRDVTASLDRIDSYRGYVDDNLQWVHKDINFMKQSFHQNYFIELCCMVADHHRKNQEEACQTLSAH